MTRISVSSLALVLAFAVGCQRGCGSEERPGAPTPSASAAASASAAPPPAKSFELALTDHFPKGVVFSPDGHYLATGGHDETVVWELPSGAAVHVFPGAVEQVAWSADGHRLAVADQSNIRVLDLTDETTAVRLTAGETAPRVHGLTWIGSNEVAAWLESGELVRLVDGKPTLRLRLVAHTIQFAAWDASHERVALAPDDPALPLEVVSGADFRTRQTLSWKGRDRVVLALRFSPDGTKLAGLDNRVENGVRVWDLASRKELPTPQSPKDRVNDLAWSPDGERLALAAHDGSVHEINPRDGREIRARAPRGRNGQGVAWAPDGRTLALTERGLTLHDAETLEPSARLWVPSDDTVQISCARERDAFVGVGHEGELVLWDLASGSLRVLPKLGQDAFLVAWAANDTQWVVVAKKEVRVVDANTSSVVRTLALELPTTERDVPSPDGKWLAQIRARVAPADGGVGGDAADALPPDLPPAPEVEASREGIGLGAIATGRLHLLLRPLDGGPLRDLGVVAGNGTLSFSHDSKRVAVVTDRGLEIFDVEGGRALRRVTTPAHGNGPMGTHLDPFGALSPDGSELASAGHGYSEIEVWRVSDGARARHFRGFGGSPLVWAADGRSLASSGAWRTADDGRALAELFPAPGARTCIGPESRWVAVVSDRDVTLGRRDQATLHLRRIPVGLDWKPFAWRDDGHFDGDAEAIRRVWMREARGAPHPAADLQKSKEPGLIASFGKSAE